MLAAGLVIWLIIVSIEPDTYLSMNNNLVDATTILLWISAVGQTAFVLMWFTRPWHEHWVGRALMVKSMSLAVYLDFAIILHYTGPFEGLPLLAVILFGFIAVGIVSQFLTLAVVTWLSERNRKTPFPPWGETGS
jgi:hypothetical protein